MAAPGPWYTQAAGQGDLAAEVQPELYPGHRGGADPAELLSAAGEPEHDGGLQSEQPEEHREGHRVGDDRLGEADGGERAGGAGGPGRVRRSPYHGDQQRWTGAVRHPAGQQRRGRIRAVLRGGGGPAGTGRQLLQLRRHGVFEPRGHACGVSQPDRGRGVRL